MTPKPPDWDVTTYRKSTRTREKIGVGWTNDPDGRVILKFDKPVTIPADRDLVVTLFKKTPRVWGADEEDESAPAKKSVKSSGPSPLDRMEELAGQMATGVYDDIPVFLDTGMVPPPDGSDHLVNSVRKAYDANGDAVLICCQCAGRVDNVNGMIVHTRNK